MKANLSILRNILFNFALSLKRVMEERWKVIDRTKEREWVLTKHRNTVNVALRYRLHKDVHRFAVSSHKRRFQKICNMMETSDEARVSKIANDETINNSLDISIYENAFDKCYRFIWAWLLPVPRPTITVYITLFQQCLFAYKFCI